MTRFTFGPFCLDTEAQQLWREQQLVALRPRPLAVLQYLVEHAGQVVSSNAVFKEVWAGTYVSKASLKVGIRAIREALGDDAEVPQYIETVGRVGYRFIAAVQSPKSKVQSQDRVVSSQQSVVSREEEESEKSKVKVQKSKVEDLAPSTQHPALVLVGRDTELIQLHNLFSKALTGERQIVFVSGEVGIGKTALVEVFVSGVRRPASQEESPSRSRVGTAHLAGSKSPEPRAQSPEPGVQVAAGQCIEHYGPGEAYLPVLEALGRLCRQTEGERVVSVLRRVAPSWLLQLPALLSEEEQVALQQQVAGTSRERMLREVVEAFDALSAEHPLVMVLEDLHWSDGSTIDLLNMLARRREPARLLIVGTLRGMDLIANDHPLKIVKQELVARGYATELPLPYLNAAAVRTYVAQQLREGANVETIATSVYQRTAGHALFMVQLTDYLQQRATLNEDEESGIPAGLRDVLEARIGRLSEEEQRVLEIGSVAGTEFITASVAVGIEASLSMIETLCERLARRGEFLDDRGVTTWPDGTRSGRYGFRHALYQEVLYQQLGRGRQARLHQAIGERLEQAYGAQAAEIAAQLAVHFERGQDHQRAVSYLHRAGKNASRRGAYQEAAMLCKRALALLPLWTDPATRTLRELELHLGVGQALMLHKGYSAPEVEHAYRQALALCQEETPARLHFQVLSGLASFWIARGQFRRALELAEQSLMLARQLANTLCQLQAQMLLGISYCYLGEPRRVCESMAPGVASFATHPPQTTWAADEVELVVPCLSYTAVALWTLGYPEQARQRSAESLALARQCGRPAVLTLALYLNCWLLQDLRDIAGTRAAVEELLTLTSEYELPFWRTWSQTYQGWVLIAQGNVREGIRQVHESLVTLQAAGAEGGFSDTLMFLAEAYGKDGQPEKGLALLVLALHCAVTNGECYYEAEAYRLRGELLLTGVGTEESQKPVLSPVEGVKIGSGNWERGSGDLPSSSPNPPSQILDPASAAEECFHKAIEVARQQHAKSLELRAVMSLVRLRQSQASEYGSRNTQHATHASLIEAHTMLFDVYNWFTEGFDTKDLQEAKTLLESLGV